jgi:DUF1680 family protein
MPEERSTAPSSGETEELMRRVDPFDYEGVRLLPSRFLTQVEAARDVYGSLPDDDILMGFREAAGLAAPGQGMSGWCQSSSAVIFGQLLSGMVRLGKASDDRALIEKAVRLFEGWQDTLPLDGNARMRLYDWDKLVCGLVDLAKYANVESLPALRRTTQWASRTFDRARRPADGHDFWGAGPGDTSEWYTLPENLYRAYQLSGERIFKDFADVWLYEEYWRPFAQSSTPPHVLPVHAYSHVNAFSSAAMAYAVSGEKRYLDICINAFDFLQQTQCYATGGYGPDERLMPPDGSLGRALDVNAYHAEIPCGSWAAFKLCLYLMRFTGEARYGDWIETILYNSMGASLPTEPDGKTFYYGDYSMSAGRKSFYWHEWPCCSGTYLQNMAEYHNMIFLRDSRGIFVNLFIPAEARWIHDGVSVVVRQETLYPESEEVVVRLAMPRPCAFTLHVRVPLWSNGLTIALNGVSLEVSVTPGRWASIDRLWQDGDQVDIKIPLQLRGLPVDRQHPDRVAVLYGPVVLAQDEACCRRPLSLAPQTELATRLVKEGPTPRFRILNTVPERHTRYLIPLYSLPPYWPYWVYFDLHAPPLY